MCKDLMIIEGRILSTDLVEIINEFRKLEEGKAELKHNDFMKKIRKEVETLKTLGLDADVFMNEGTYIDKKNQERLCYSLNREGIKIILSYFRGSMAISAKKVADKLGIKLDVIFSRTRFEESFDNVLREMCLVFGFEYKTQVVIDNYRLDFYFEDLNVVLEYDEKQHFTPANIKADEERQNYLMDKLGCTILLVDYKDTDVYNASLVIKELLEIKNEKDGK